MTQKKEARKILKQKSPKPISLPQTLFTLSPMNIAQRDLEVVSSRLRRRVDLAVRLKLDDLDISIDQYINRLSNRKRELILELDDNSKPKLSKSRASQKYPPPPFVPIKPLRPSLGDASLTIRDPRFDGIERLPFNFGKCTTHTNSQLTELYHTWDDESGVRHNSDTFYSLDVSHVLSFGTCLFIAKLDDDASFWRHDEEDIYIVNYASEWELPEQNCNGVMICNIDSYGQVEFSNNADDGGGFEVWHGMLHTNFEGEWEDNGYRLGDWFTQILTGSSSGSYIQERFNTQIYFPIKKQKKSKVWVGFAIALSAQDGLVTATGQLGTHDSSGFQLVQPRLNYTFIPYELPG